MWEAKQRFQLPVWIEQNPSSILLDTQPLTAFVIGTENPRILGQSPVEGFTHDDILLLGSLLSRFSPVTTPTILAEVNGWINRDGRERFRERLADILPAFNEIYVDSRELVRTKSFIPFGLTDSSIVEAARNRKLLVVTTDRRLVQSLRFPNLLHFDDLRAAQLHI